MSFTHIITYSNTHSITEKRFRLNCIAYKLTKYMFSTTYIIITYMSYME